MHTFFFIEVTPSHQDIAEANTEGHSSWKPAEPPENAIECPEPERVLQVPVNENPNDSNMARTDPSRKSKANRVKGYIRRCKDALASKTVHESNPEIGRSAWYIAEDKSKTKIENCDEKQSCHIIPAELHRCETSGEIECTSDNKNALSVVFTVEIDQEQTVDIVQSLDAEDLKTSDGEVEIIAENLSVECTESSENRKCTESAENAESTESAESEVFVETEQEQNECAESTIVRSESDDLQGSLCSMLDRSLGGVIPQYASVRNSLLRQARDLLVCAHLGDLDQFERCFLVPAAELIATIIRQQAQIRGVVVSGWPVTLYRGGLALHLGELDPSYLTRTGDCYLCVRPCDVSSVGDQATHQSSDVVELALIWRGADREIHSRRLEPGTPDSSLGLQMDVLPDLLRGLLITVERAVERAPLEALAFPCPLCGRCYESWMGNNANTESQTDNTVCRCREYTVPNKDNQDSKCKETIQEKGRDQQSSELAGAVFALGGSIPHIDSDEDEELPNKRLSAMTGMLTKLPHDVVPPKAIKDLSEKLLTCGITFPGTRDISGRPLVIVDASELSRAGLSCFEVATLLLYYTSLPSEDSLQRGIAVLVLLDETGEHDQRIWELLDTSLLLLGARVPAQIVLTWEPNGDENNAQPSWRNEQPALLPCSRIQCYRCLDSHALSQYLPSHQTPERCGGSARHDQREWIRFFREYEAFRERCCEAGRRLMSEAKECNTTDEHNGKTVTRKSLHRQHRALSRSLLCPALRALRRDSPGLLAQLAGRAHGASAGSSDEVAAALVAARRLAAEIERACQGLEMLAERRRERLRELAREQALEHETDEVLSWMRHSGEDMLQTYISGNSSNNQDAKRQEQDFEQFYFISMRQLDRGADLCEEAAKRTPLQSTVLALRAHMRDFSTRLEAARERLEESARIRINHSLTSTTNSNQTDPNNQQKNKDNSQQISQSSEWDIENEERGGDSGIGACVNCEDRAPKNGKALDRSCSCRCYSDPDQERADGSEGCPMSNCTDELEDESFEPQTSTPKPRGPLEVNSHLHCHASNIDLPDINDLPGATDIDPKTYKTLLLITREMIQTERDYVKSLDYIIDHYLPELLRDDIPQALRGQRNVVFGNVEKIYEFHNQHFLRELERCENNPLQIGRSFLRHEKKFYLYALYNKNKPKSDSLMSEYGSSFFKSKQLELGDKMDLASYLLKPVQRMGKYALLLQQLMKAVAPEGSENSADLDDLKNAEQMVRFQLRHGNDLLAMDSLRECDVNVKEQGRLLRQNEFLVWEGKSGKKSMRQVFLFEDLILFSKARRFPDHKNLDLYIYKNSIKTSDIGLTARIGDSSTKFEIWFRKRKPNDTFTLQSMSEDVKKAWTEEISQLLWKQALRNREVRLAEMSSMGIGNKPCLDIRPSCDQISDRSISIAQLSKTAPRFRNSISSSTCSELSLRVSKRPHSVISVSSSSASSSGSSSSANSSSACSTASRTNTTDSHVRRSLGATAVCVIGKQHKSPKAHHRSTTLNSQCSTESGILADISLSDDMIPDGSHIWNSSSLSKSSSSASSSDATNILSNPSPETINSENNLKNIPNYTSCNQMPLLLYQNDQDVTVNL